MNLMRPSKKWVEIDIILRKIIIHAKTTAPAAVSGSYRGLIRMCG